MILKLVVKSKDTEIEFLPSEKLLFFILLYMLDWKHLFTLLPYYSCFYCDYWEEKWTLKRVPCLFEHSLSFTILVSLQLS